MHNMLACCECAQGRPVVVQCACFAVEQVFCARAAVQFVVSNQAAACRCHAYIRVPSVVTCGLVCMSSVAG